MSTHKLYLQRCIYNTEPHRNIIGELYADDIHLLDTLEDEVRPNGVKVNGETCIPAGDDYIVRLTFSNRFQRIMPLIFNRSDLSVQGKGVRFDGVRFHRGVTEKHTHGCVLTGECEDNLTLTNGKEMEEKLIAWLKGKGDVPLVLVDKPLTADNKLPRHILD